MLGGGGSVNVVSDITLKPRMELYLVTHGAMLIDRDE